MAVLIRPPAQQAASLIDNSDERAPVEAFVDSWPALEAEIRRITDRPVTHVILTQLPPGPRRSSTATMRSR